MGACKETRVVLMEKRAQGWSIPALRALRDYLNEGKSNPIAIRSQWGRISWNVSDTLPNEQKGIGLEVVVREEVPGEIGQYLTRVVNTGDLITLTLPKVETLEQLIKDVYKADAAVDMRNTKTYEEARVALLIAGYDAIRTSDGKMYIMNNGKVDVTSKRLIGEAVEEDMDFGFPPPPSEMWKPKFEIMDIKDTVHELWGKYGSTLPVRWNGRKEVNRYKILSTEKAGNDLVVYTNIGKMVFPIGSDVAKYRMNNSEIHVTGMGQASSDIYKHLGEVYRSKGGPAEGLVEVDVHGDTAKMVDFMKSLNEISGKQDSKEHIKYLEELIKGMDERFFTTMKTYLNDQAEETKGQVTIEDKMGPTETDRINVQVARKKHAGNDQSGAEVYAHEVVHAYTLWALKVVSSAADVMRRRLRHLRDVTMEELKKKYDGEGWRVFMPKVSIDVRLEENAAKEAWKYVFENSDSNSLAEYVAYMATNPELVNESKKIQVVEEKVGKSLFERLSQFITVVMDVLSGKYRWGAQKENVQAEVLGLMHQLGRINNNAQVKINERESVVNKIASWFDSKDEALAEKLADYWEKKTKKMVMEYSPMPRGKGKIAMAKWFAKYLPLLLTNREMRPIVSGMLKMVGASSTGIVQNIMRDIWNSDELKQSIHGLMRMAGKIDRVREALAKVYGESIVAGFKVKLTEEQEAALTRVVMDTDMQSIWESYSKEEIAKMLKDETALDKAIETAKSELIQTNGKQKHWNVNQATALGYFMATGKGNLAQSLNAENIARGTGQFDDNRVPMKGEVEAIDKLATLVAMKYTDAYQKQRVAKLMVDEKVGVENIIKHAKLFAEQSKAELFEDAKRLMIKGYSKELFNDSIAIEIAPAKDEADMKWKGYKKIKDLEVDKTAGPIQMALYRSEAFNKQEYYRTTTKLTGIGRRGTSMMQVALSNYGSQGFHMAKVAKQRSDIARKELVLKLEKEYVDVEDVAGGKIPAVDGQGNIIDYQYVMDKTGKELALEQDIGVSRVIGRSLASVYDKGATEEHNEAVLKLIMEDMDVNYIPSSMVGNNGYAYMEIGPKADNEKGRKIWKMMPQAMQKKVLDASPEGIAVREDMVEEYFGFRHWSAADNQIIRYFPQIVRTAVKILEEMWQSVVAVAKVDILIRMPFVVIGNIVNNIVYGIQTRSGPREILKLYVAQWNNIREYMRVHAELLELEAAERAGNVRGKDLSRIASLRATLTESPINELMESGIYESIIEDLNEQEAKEKGLLNAWMQEKTKNSPEWVKTGWNWFTLNRNTAWYKNMEIMLRMGDLVGQAVENEKRKQIDIKSMRELKASMKKEGKTDEYIAAKMAETQRMLDKNRIDELSEEFIYYSAPASAMEEYANRMGLVMFTKFYKRYQKVLVKSALNRPLRTAMLIGIDHWMFNDGLETPTDQFVIDKMIDGRALSMFQNPLNLVHLNTPIGLRFLTETL